MIQLQSSDHNPSLNRTIPLVAALRNGISLQVPIGRETVMSGITRTPGKISFGPSMSFAASRTYGRRCFTVSNTIGRTFGPARWKRFQTSLPTLSHLGSGGPPPLIFPQPMPPEGMAIYDSRFSKSPSTLSHATVSLVKFSTSGKALKL